MPPDASSSAKVIPAQLDFLAIYNPALGNTDETAHEQILYFYERKDPSRRRQKSRPVGSRDTSNDNRTRAAAAGKSGHTEEEIDEKDAEEEAKNGRLRRVGLARGMVEFANNFSTNKSIDTIETEKSRIVLQELEPGWWVLASINLTRLPAAAKSTANNLEIPKTRTDASQGKFVNVDYSAREVSPPQLLLKQLQQANALFLLHHAHSIEDLFKKHDRASFTAILARFWDSFAHQWDVLLHGNPAVDIYGGAKLAAGGELGIGVGEEEWGSGEREVLEGFLLRTAGLVDLVVGRYGDEPEINADPADSTAAKNDKGRQKLIKQQSQPIVQEPWLGSGECPRASDGIVFSGTGIVSKRSLATISQWMDAIFTYGEDAYGIGINPNSRPRPARRKRVGKQDKVIQNQERKTLNPTGTMEAPNPLIKSPRGRTSDLRRRAMENSAAPPSTAPGIPAPLVGQVEVSLERALAKASSRESSRSPREEKSQADAMGGSKSQSEEQSSPSGTDTMMKYLSLGYGTSWTLNPKGFQSSKTSAEGKKDGKQWLTSPRDTDDESGDDSSNQQLETLDPTPDISDDEAESFVQRLEQSIGKFLIGLSGDLENAEFEPDTDANPDEDVDASNHRAQRVFMRTIIVEMTKPHARRSSLASRHSGKSDTRSIGSNATITPHERKPSAAGKTSASASVDGANPHIYHEKLQVAVYVHQPFIFVFLFELHTPNLTIPSFYRGIHHQLGPLQKPLLHSTDPKRVFDRIADLLMEKSGSTLDKDTNEKAYPEMPQQPIYDLIYDPSKFTVRTSIPNIPMPGTLAAEGLGAIVSSKSTSSGTWYTLGIPVGNSFAPDRLTSSSVSREGRFLRNEWTRLDALNVHTQILNTLAATKGDAKGEVERTVKTGRGWWVLWMQITASNNRNRFVEGWLEDRNNESPKEAFLVRKAAAEGPGGKEGKTLGISGKWLLREQTGDSGGNRNSPGASMGNSARGVGEGVGVDARKWIDGLLHLSQ